uniref:Uncharacterized protein n=1 Tax=Timema monikensis TaxID=170555 RepID=A0A7R9E1U0_9NEOP|nr:unnamed protein product [Timema monikensis]
MFVKEVSATQMFVKGVSATQMFVKGVRATRMFVKGVSATQMFVKGFSSVEESNAPSVPHGRKGRPFVPFGFSPSSTLAYQMDYKEHGTRNKDEPSLRRDETALSSPSLSSWSSPSSRSRDERSSSSSGSNDSGLSSRSSSSSGSPSSTSEKYSNSGSVETVFVKSVGGSGFLRFWAFGPRHLRFWAYEPGPRHSCGEELILASLGIRPEPDHPIFRGWELELLGYRPRSCSGPQCPVMHADTDMLGSGRPALSWTSTPDLGNLSEDTRAQEFTVSLTLPRKKLAPTPDTGQDSTPSDSYTLRRRTTESSLPSEARRSPTPTSTFSSNEQPSQRHKKVTENSRSVKEDSCETGRQRLSKDTSTTSSGKQRRLQIQSLKETRSIDEPTNPEVEFIIQVKSSNTKKSSKKDSISGPNQNTPSVGTCTPYSSGNKRLTIPSYSGSGGSSSAGGGSSGTSSEESYEEDSDNDDISSTTGTENTETTLVDRNENELQEQIESLKQELDMMRNRCERVEREKSDILLSRIASMHTAPSKTAASEVLKLQQKVNDLQTQSEDLLDEKKSLSLRVKELEDEVESRPDNNTTKRTLDDLRSKLLAAENLCEELMDENEDMKKELQDLEEEIEELQDNFREEQADEYTTLKKELEQTAKNCRILSFKLRKAERKAEQMEAEKLEAEKKCREMAGGLAGLDKVEKIKQLEQDLALANEVGVRLKKELDDVKEKLESKEYDSSNQKSLQLPKKKAPMLGSIGKTSSGEKVSRESLTRGGSQEDPVQLLRDLQDSLEREADLREQLRYAEEEVRITRYTEREGEIFRKKASRVEDDNESLVLQLKKMATKARSRVSSVYHNSLYLQMLALSSPTYGGCSVGITFLLDDVTEFFWGEATVLRKKVGELETENETMKRKVKDIQEKLNTKTARKTTIAQTKSNDSKSGNGLNGQKIKVLEEDVSELRKKLIEKERDCERLHAELTVTQKRLSKGSMHKSKSLDSGNEQHNLDLKRQLQLIEQEAAILRTKVQILESDNDKLSAENKRLELLRGTKKGPTSLETQVDVELKGKIEEMETQLANANKQAENDNKSLTLTIDRLKEETASNLIKFYKQRTPKKPTDFTTKLQLKKMVEELENEIGEVLVALKKSEEEKSKLPKYDGNNQNNEELKEANEKLTKDLQAAKTRLESLEKELKEQKEVHDKENDKFTIERKTADEASLSVKKDEMTELVKKLEAIKDELEEEKRQNISLKKQVEIGLKSEQEKKALNIEILEKITKISEVEKKLKETEDKLKKVEKISSNNKGKVAKLEKELEEEREKVRVSESTQQEMTSGWLKERDSLKDQISELQNKTRDLEKTITSKQQCIEKLEINLKDEKARAVDISKNAASVERQENETLKEDLATNKSKLLEVTQKLQKVETMQKSSEEKYKKDEADLKKEKQMFESKVAQLETDLQAERKKMDRMKATHEKETKNREHELSGLRTKLRSLESNTGITSKKIQEEYQTKIEKLEEDLSREKQEYEDLTTKYEILEEEHVGTKSQLVKDKELVYRVVQYPQQDGDLARLHSQGRVPAGIIILHEVALLEFDTGKKLRILGDGQTGVSE